ncbi:hypothetical protein B9Z65_1433 [Elsinoe australis]|uniref:Uncharacterized protein n=1 Tax=Elsinoe australis TaxID=40998 RepID=A0A2P7YFW0_9PEZI|nr:hypothetical protein B9Z65_1433 [Elsinoe australis]
MTPHKTNFQPTSLDFINRPNPVEPSNISQGQGPSSSKQLESRTNEELLRVLRDSRLNKSSRDVAKELGVSHPQSPRQHQPSTGPFATSPNQDDDSPSSEGNFFLRPRDAEQARFTLPPPTQQSLKRQRHQVPPVLQGLHQPPPNAGLLPSIDAENRQPIHRKQGAETSIRLDNPVPEAERPQKTVVIKLPSNATSRPTRRNKWTDEETHALLQGVRRFGAGSWKKILTCSDYSFNHRTATDLKDRFRVVCSNKEMLMHFKIYAEYMKNPPDLTQDSHLAAAAEARAAENQSKDSSSDQLDLPRAKRRQRTKWSEEEDAALLRGFGRYGPSWTSIQLDPVLKKRTPTDIRDRIRTRFSEEYTKAGLAPKPSKPRTQMRSQPKPAPSRQSTSSLPKLMIASSNRTEQTPSAATSASRSAIPPSSSLPPMDDSWYTDVPIPFDSTHPLAHLLKNNHDANTSLPSLPSILPPIGPTEQHDHNLCNQPQSIHPLVTVLGKTGGYSNIQHGAGGAT